MKNATCNWQQYINTMMLNERLNISGYLSMNCLFNSLFRLTPQETSKLRITGPLWGESTKGQWCRDRASPCDGVIMCWGVKNSVTLPCRNIATSIGKLIPYSMDYFITWWRHQMEAFSALLTICVGNSPVTGEFPAQRAVTRSFDVFFDLRLNKRLS